MKRRSRPLAALAVAALAAAQGTLALPRPAAAEVLDDTVRIEWQQRLGAARAELERARERSEAAAEAVQKMRHRRHPRGAAREALFAERDAADQELAEAKRALDDLLEQARRAGVPPGWLRAEGAQGAAAPR